MLKPYSKVIWSFLPKLILVMGLGVMTHCQTTGSKLDTAPFYSEAHLDLKKWKRETTCCSATGNKIAIASGGTYSSQAGLEIAKAGGNLVDVATATAFALAVERPHSLGLGGGGFLTLHWQGKSYFIDFRETAPQRASQDMYLDKSGNPIANSSVAGALAVATPGFVAGWAQIHHRWGRLPWQKLLAPAIRLAREGFPVYPSLAETFEQNQLDFQKDPYLKKLATSPQGKLWKIGDRFTQKDLAKTLELIAAQGKRPFYETEIAQRIVREVKRRGGILELKDLYDYTVKERTPIVGKFGDFTYVSAPPPSAGGLILAETFNVLSEFDLAKEAKRPERYAHLLAETFKRGYADRAQYVGDPDFVKPDYEFMLSNDYAAKLRKEFSWEKTHPSSQISHGSVTKESPDTNQLTVMDSEGNAASSTLTINTSFGAILAVPGTGIYLNNEMDDFSIKPGIKNAYGLTGSVANAIQPKKRPVSSMMPTILLKDNVAVLALGGKGGSRIITSVIQVILNQLFVFPQDLKKSVFAPRIHHQWLPDRLDLEDGFAEQTKEKLTSLGHSLGKGSWYAEVHAVQRNLDGSLTAVFDPRDEGGANAQ